MNHLQSLDLAYDESDEDELPEVRELRERWDESTAAGDLEVDSFTLRRFIDADRRKGAANLDASLARLERTVEWRATNKMDCCMTRSRIPLKLGHYLDARVRVVTGLSIDGSTPVQFERIGAFIGRGLCVADEAISGLTAEDWVECYAADLELMFIVTFRGGALRAKREMDKYMYCADMSGIGDVSIAALFRAIKLISLLARDIEVCYCEMVIKIILFNVPSRIVTLWGLLAGFMDPAIATKIELHGDVPLERFAEIMPPSAVPIEYGGESMKCYPDIQPTGRRWASRSLEETRFELLRRAHTWCDGEEMKLPHHPAFAHFFHESGDVANGGGADAGSAEAAAAEGSGGSPASVMDAVEEWQRGASAGPRASASAPAPPAPLAPAAPSSSPRPPLVRPTPPPRLPARWALLFALPLAMALSATWSVAARCCLCIEVLLLVWMCVDAKNSHHK